LIDAVAVGITTVEEVALVVQELKEKGLDIELEVGTVNAALKEGKFFACMLAAWDLMLSPAPVNRRQRKADLDQLKTAIDATCSDVFPATLAKMMDMWVEGKDVVSVLP